MDIKDLLKRLVKEGASDLHLKVGTPPCLRVSTLLERSDLPSLTQKDIEQLALSVMDDEQKRKFDQKKEVDMAYSVSGLGRFRINIFRQRGYVSMAIRRLLAEPPSFDELGLPPSVRDLAEQPRGLVLVTGTAGSGKTTTLSSMIEHINQNRRCHIITIEDPIEILHKDKKSIINQREIGDDTSSYSDALRYVVRQNPDVLLIGEMRDLETIRIALSAAEMGNLVLSTFHTVDVVETINRMIDFFPPYHQRLARIMIAFTLKGVISQRLLPKMGGGLVPAVELMVTTATIREYILKPDETSKIREAIEKGEYYGMQTFDQHLLKLYSTKRITLEDAMIRSANVQDFKLKVKQLGFEEEAKGKKPQEVCEAHRCEGPKGRDSKG